MSLDFHASNPENLTSIYQPRLSRAESMEELREIGNFIQNLVRECQKLSDITGVAIDIDTCDKRLIEQENSFQKDPRELLSARKEVKEQNERGVRIVRITLTYFHDGEKDLKVINGTPFIDAEKDLRYVINYFSEILKLPINVSLPIDHQTFSSSPTANFAFIVTTSGSSKVYPFNPLTEN